MEITVRLKDVYFSQDSIAATFTNGSPLELDSIKDFPKIEVVHNGDRFYTLNNRYLYVLKEFSGKEKIDVVLKHKDGSFKRKFTGNGIDLRVRVPKKIKALALNGEDYFLFADPPHYFLSGDQWYNVQEKIDEIWKNEEEILKIFVGCNGHYYIDTGKSCYWNLRNFDSDDYECILWMAINADGGFYVDSGKSWHFRDICDSAAQSINALSNNGYDIQSVAFGPGDEWIVRYRDNSGHETHKFSRNESFPEDIWDYFPSESEKDMLYVIGDEYTFFSQTGTLCRWTYLPQELTNRKDLTFS